jgi:DnaK suppressor protein
MLPATRTLRDRLRAAAVRERRVIRRTPGAALLRTGAEPATPAGRILPAMSARPHSHLSAADLDHLRTALRKKRDELLAAQRSSHADQRGIAADEIEDGDVAERMIEQEAALRIGAFDASLLTEVERALKKIDDGGYGVSEDSGAPIPLERLTAVPWARRTAQEEEHRRG